MNEIAADEDLLPVRVAGKRAVTPDLCLFELVSEDGGELPEFDAGAHIAVRTPGGGMRQFSLCNDPAERDRYELGIKAERDGRGGSAGMVDTVEEGDRLLIEPPANDFPLAPAKKYLFIAGGIGITPILSMIRRIVREGEASFRLVYCTRSRQDTPFLDVLAEPGIAEFVTLHHDGGDPERVFDFWDLFETPDSSEVYCCGPTPMMEEIRGVSGHWPQSAIHFEEFHSGVEAVREDDRAFVVVHAGSGERYEVGAGQTILEALREQGVNLRSSCESGTCGTCRTKLVSGTPDHRDLVLMDEEKSDYVMVCVSRASSDELVLDW